MAYILVLTLNGPLLPSYGADDGANEVRWSPERTWEWYQQLLQDAPPDAPGGPQESIPHIADFIQSVRTREKPAADAETGHCATTFCHLINRWAYVASTRSGIRTSAG